MTPKKCASSLLWVGGNYITSLGLILILLKLPAQPSHDPSGNRDEKNGVPLYPRSQNPSSSTIVWLFRIPAVTRH